MTFWCSNFVLFTICFYKVFSCRFQRDKDTQRSRLQLLSNIRDRANKNCFLVFS